MLENNKIILDGMKQLSMRENFDCFVNTQNFEREITSLSNELELTEVEQVNLIKELDDNLEKNKNYAFCLFFVLFTKMRRNKIKNLAEFVDDYSYNFYNFKITEFIELLTQFIDVYDEKGYLRLLKKTDKLIHSKGETFDFTNHKGILNFFVELVCSYFELQLDDRFEDNLSPYLTKASKVIDEIIESFGGEKVYPKYYLNKGRVLVLMQKYKEGEKFITQAIRSVELGAERERTVREFEQYRQKANTIKTYDLTAEKIKELDSIKVNNTKSLALMTSLLGFLLGSINIFAQVNDVFTLAMLMLSYVGLLLILTGVVFFGLSLSIKEKRKMVRFYDLALLALGVIIFTTTVTIILNH